MIFHLFVFNLILNICNTQEHLTCLRTNDVLRPQPTVSTRIQQGPPGKRGPIGLKGDTGSKGNKGDPGIPDQTPINALRGEINELRQLVIATQAESSRLFKDLGNGWATIFNGYQYKMTTRKQSWAASRSTCRRLGGDLAVYGVQNMESRRLILRALSVTAEYIWIGLNDERTEGNWHWVNGERAVPSAVFWARNQPDNYRNNQDCGLIYRNNDYGSGTDDGTCSFGAYALCEKQFNA